jgi:hypothetical protein
VLAQNVYDGCHRVMVEAFDSTKPVRITVPVHMLLSLSRVVSGVSVIIKAAESYTSSSAVSSSPAAIMILVSSASARSGLSGQLRYR